MTAITLTVNGQSVNAQVTPRTHLADFLREHLLLTGTHIGCEHGICGACTVEINGEIARSCITYAVACDGAEVRTIEGFDDDDLMARLRQAFSEAHALQCGYCTPGMLIAARDLIRRKGGLTGAQIRTEMSGNLCRCTGYVGIVRAIERVMLARPTLSLPTASPHKPQLGPAPGPQPSGSPAAETKARSATVRVSDASAGAKTGTTPRPSAGSAKKRRRIKVETGSVEASGGATRLTQVFVLEHPRVEVWRLMADAEAVARCIPGMRLDGPLVDGRAAGRMELALGPIKASFAGEGLVVSFPNEFRQVITGAGGDRKSGSSASGEVAYRLREEVGPAGEDLTRVEVELSYSLTGPLAQFSRSNLVRDLVSRVGENFAQNLDARLSMPDGAEIAPTRLGAASLMWRVAVDHIRAGVAKILGRPPS
ncbi:MAG: 2Fe-2S iron-sulfur cluster binding domain-containing protein [Hyphomicrobiales bacterium]|nr:2Fe-2S iron-sulfur cluster binding domain-containing protein [Hyphomicrobiales bacterium]